MAYEVLVLFGGSMVVFSLKRKRDYSSKRYRGLVWVSVMLAELIVMVAGVSVLLMGIIQFYG